MAEQWTVQTLNRLETLFFSHTTNVPHSQQMFANLLKQHELDPSIVSVTESISSFFLMVSLWGLVRMHQTTDLESRRQYGVFINHLQDAETALLKSIQIHQKNVLAKSIPPSRVVQTLPISTTTQL